MYLWAMDNPQFPPTDFNCESSDKRTTATPIKNVLNEELQRRIEIEDYEACVDLRDLINGNPDKFHKIEAAHFSPLL